MTRTVTDPEALRRFNEDEDYMTAIDLDSYLGYDVWDENGESLMSGAALDRRFEAAPGEVASPDFVGPVSGVTCFDGTRAWG